MIKIKIYSTPFCAYCKIAKDFFDKKGLSYEEVDVSVDEKAAQEMVARTNQVGVPVIEIGEEVIIGFNKSQIEKILTASGGLS